MWSLVVVFVVVLLRLPAAMIPTVVVVGVVTEPVVGIVVLTLLSNICSDK